MAADLVGREAGSPTAIPSREWWDIAKRTFAETSSDNAALIAAGIAFYAFLAMVPLLGAIVLIYGLIAEPATVIDQARSLTGILPPDIAGLIGDQLLSVVAAGDGKKGLGLLVALALALWGARNAAGAIVSALNIAYEEEERRGFVAVTLLSLAMTVAAIAVVFVGGVTIALATQLQHLLPDLGWVGIFAGKVLSYVVVIILASAATASIYRYGPCRAHAKWRWITPGSLLFAVAWCALTQAFGYYVANFGNYNLTYGSLGAVVILLTWLYLSGYVLIVGAELNSEIEHQTAVDSTVGVARPLGQREAWSADHVAGEGGPISEAPCLTVSEGNTPGNIAATAKGMHPPASTDVAAAPRPARPSMATRQSPRTSIALVIVGGALALALPSLLRRRRLRSG